MHILKYCEQLRVFTNLVDDMKSLIVLFTNMVECGKVKSMNAFFYKSGEHVVED